jgi:hypothetical protein
MFARLLEILQVKFVEETALIKGKLSEPVLDSTSSGLISPLSVFVSSNLRFLTACFTILLLQNTLFH